MSKLEVILVEPQNFVRLNEATGVDLGELRRIYDASLKLNQICLAHVSGRDLYAYEFLKEGAA